MAQPQTPSDPTPDLHGGETGWKKWRKHLPHVLGLVLMVAAIGVVQHEVRHLRLSDIRQATAAIPAPRIMLAVGCTLLSYFVLSFYDRLAVIQVGYRNVPFRRAAFAAFCSYVLSHNLGFSAISGAAVRYRLYRNWGVDSFAITQIIAFCSATYLLGAAVLIGGVLIWEPAVLPGVGAHVPAAVLAVIGALLWLAVAAYIGVAFRVREVRWRTWVVALPSPAMAVMQTVVATAEVAATASIAFVLLPENSGVDFGSFLAIYIASYTAGLVASVPGGLGVFDGAMLLALAPYMKAPAILGMVLTFRLLYYIIPLFLAGLMFAGHELFLRGDAALAKKKAAGLSGPASTVQRRPSQVVRESEAAFSVAVATGTVSLCGLLLVCLVLMDPVPKFAILPDSLAWFAQVSGNYLLSLMGVALIGMAIGLSQRVTLAWRGALVLLLVATVLTFLRGNTVFVPIMLGLSTLFIAPYRTSYYRHARLLSEPLAASTLLSLLLLFGCVVTLATRNGVGGSWWQLVLAAQQHGAARWTVALSVLLALVVVVRLMWPGRIAVRLWTDEAYEQYRALAHAMPDVLALQPEGFVMGEAGEAMIPFFVRDGFLIGLGDPAGGEDDSISAIWRLRDLALQEGLKIGFWRVGETFLRIYDDIGLSVWPLEDGSGQNFCYPSSDIALASRLAKLYEQRPGPAGVPPAHL
ncbi:lysylphosphatidylglycerol synthase domain-containing protein [Acetobacter sp. TBRC 12305]|uniref:Lysylphosphatidylglycerol synthetase family protein n=1 Tax=Acetobacter garciniae TaxID=2817435 RepID=A0A939KPE7_9PROT|nr:lysylphosphatidylglycerol synthase domain-containing protein [Acetobacter garciniae]MBO1323802.1 lysylphosphatidylglycerol synthetase family protein [Acetobacter garciniae]MBX0343491.1 lysylphosphatidylglycerol synthase domain-containing protein [Acetobacter garciniae]